MHLIIRLVLKLWEIQPPIGLRLVSQFCSPLVFECSFQKQLDVFLSWTKELIKAELPLLGDINMIKASKLPYLGCWKKMDQSVFSRHSLSKLERNIHKEKWWINKMFNPFTHKKKPYEFVIYSLQHWPLEQGSANLFCKFFKQ